MARRGPLSGFPEFLPAQRYVEQQVIASLSDTFELHGFANIETRAVEPLDQLLRKGDTSKEVYVLRRLHDAPGDETDEQPANRLGLHFDLTVPFARYVLEHAGKLEFPFRRYQIQKVWRGERPQEGRFREFVQADIDIVGRDVLPFHHDVEVARVMLDALSRLDFLPGFRLQVNNRKLIQGFYRGLGIEGEALDEVMRLIDKLDKMSEADVRTQLIETAGLDDNQADRCLELARIRSTDDSFVAQVAALGVSDPMLTEGLDELAAVIRGCAPLTSDDPARPVRIEADLRIARGLDYYTGTVFETRLDGFEALGSICSGGRYDELAADGRSTYPGVGISLGLSRLLVTLAQRTGLRADRAVPSVVLVAVNTEETRDASEAAAHELRRRGIPVEVAASAAKFGKQIRYAERRGIPYVWFPPGDDGPHQVKDIRSGEQHEADPTDWTPPPADLHRQIVTTD